MSDREIFVFLSFLGLAAGFGIIVLGLRHRTKLLEMAHRERLAMIERGLGPAPERDAFAPHRSAASRRLRPVSSERRLSFGIGLVGWGVGIAILFAFAFGVPMVGLGFGGAFAAVGGAMIVIALVARRDDAPESTEPPMDAVPRPPMDADRL